MLSPAVWTCVVPSPSDQEDFREEAAVGDGLGKTTMLLGFGRPDPVDSGRREGKPPS